MRGLPAWAVGLALAVFVPIGGYVVAGLGGAVAAVLLWRALVYWILGPAAFIAIRRLGNNPGEIMLLDRQARVRHYRRLAARIGE